MAEPMYTEKVRKQISKVTKNRFPRLQLRGFYLTSVPWSSSRVKNLYLRVVWPIPVDDMLVLSFLLVDPDTTCVVVFVADFCAGALRAFAIPYTTCLLKFLNFFFGW
jgi:hypothetical protein